MPAIAVNYVRETIKKQEYFTKSQSAERENGDPSRLNLVTLLLTIFSRTEVIFFSSRFMKIGVMYICTSCRKISEFPFRHLLPWNTTAAARGEKHIIRLKMDDGVTGVDQR